MKVCCSQANMLKERKKLQRQALIERSQLQESLEQLKTYGGRPDETLMALIGDSLSNSRTSGDIAQQQAIADKPGEWISVLCCSEF